MTDQNLIAECVAALEAEYGCPDGEDEHIIEIVAPIIERHALASRWLPIETAPRECPVDRSLRPSPGAWTTETMWVRDASGRVFEAWFVEFGSYWWDADGETKCDPVEWMPHPMWKPEEGADG
jgi:hypothetical protein